MALTQMLVRTLQEGLTRWYEETHQPGWIGGAIPSPGPIDGIWGQRTMDSYAAYLRIGPSSTSAEELSAALLTDHGSQWIQVSSLTLQDLSIAAQNHQAAHPLSRPADQPAVAQPTTIGPHLDPEPVYASPAPDQGLDTFAKVGLAVLAAGAIGGVIYMVTRKRKKR